MNGSEPQGRNCPKTDSTLRERSIESLDWRGELLYKPFKISAECQGLFWHGTCTLSGVMDIARPDIKRKKRRQTMVWVGVGVVVLAAAAFGVSRLKPAAPVVDASAVWPDTVKRGIWCGRCEGQRARWCRGKTRSR